MTRLDEVEKQSIIATYKACNNITTTAAQHGICRKTARHCINQWSLEGTLENKPSTGRKSALSKAAAQRASDLLDDGEEGGANQVAKKLVAERLAPKVVHRSTLIRAARKAAKSEGCQMKATKGPPPKGLTKATQLKRLQFAKQNLKTTWSHVMFTDRKKFYFRYPGSSVKPCRWQKYGPNRPKRHEAYQPNHPQCLNVYGGITKFGVTKLHEVAGSSKHKSTFTNKKGKTATGICASEYGHLLEKTLLPEGQRLFSAKGISCWTLQQDNDPAHGDAAGVVRGWSEKKPSNARVLPNWPPNSPDLNLIENVWGYVQGNVDALGCQSFEEFKNAVHEQFKAVPSSMLSNLYSSMGKRLHSVVEKGGGQKPSTSLMLLVPPTTQGVAK